MYMYIPRLHFVGLGRMVVARHVQVGYDYCRGVSEINKLFAYIPRGGGG